MPAPRHLILPVLLALLCAPFAFAASPVTPPADPAVFHLYLLMGQSNMAGRDTRDLSAQVDDPRVLTLDSEGRWVVARDPIHPKIGRVEPGVGPGIAFARTMLADADPHVSIGLIPCAVGGSPLRRWVKGGDLYEQALARARAAGASGTLKGVLWHQGETDAAKAATADTYGERLARMIADLRQDLARPDLPVVVGQPGEFLRAETEPCADTVRAALLRLPDTVPGTACVTSAGLGHQGDFLHFDATASRELGRRFAVAMRGLQGRK